MNKNNNKIKKNEASTQNIGANLSILPRRGSKVGRDTLHFRVRLGCSSHRTVSISRPLHGVPHRQLRRHIHWLYLAHCNYLPLK